MDFMEKSMIWYAVLVKLHLKRSSTWIALLFLVVSIGIVGRIRLPDENNVRVGVYLQDSSFGAQVVETYEAGEHLFELCEYTSWEDVLEEVRSGRLCAGIRMDSELDDRIEEGQWDRGILFVTTPQSTKSAVIQESITEAALQVYNTRFLEQKAEEIFAENADSAVERMKNYVSEEKIFVQQEYVVGDTEMPKERKGHLLSGMMGISLLMILYLTAATGKSAPEKVLSRRERVWFRYLNELASALPFFMIILFGEMQNDFRVNGIRWLVFLLISAWWVMGLDRLFHREAAVVFVLLLLIMGHFILYPVVWDLAEFIPAIRFVRYLSPLFVITGV